MGDPDSGYANKNHTKHGETTAKVHHLFKVATGEVDPATPAPEPRGANLDRVPQTAAGYTLAAGHGLDLAAVEGFRPVAHQAGLSQRLVDLSLTYAKGVEPYLREVGEAEGLSLSSTNTSADWKPKARRRNKSSRA